MAFRARKTFEKELRAQPVFQAEMRARTKALAALVVIWSPRNTGYFESHIRVRGNRVVLTDPFWHLVEYGSVNNPPYAPVRRAVRELGMRSEDGRVDTPGPTA